MARYSEPLPTKTRAVNYLNVSHRLLRWTAAVLVLQLIWGTFGSANAQSLATKQADLDGRMKYWETKLPFCNWDHGAKFPSKYNDTASGPDTEAQKCNDGDFVALNGLVCAVGDDRGCDSVKRSQQADNGRWWRSPKRVFEKAKDGGSETTFSNDHALGAWAYIAQKKDKDAFNDWITWIDRNPRCGLTFNCLPTFPRYCLDDRCTFKFIDCPLLDRLALVLGEGNPVCDPLHNLENALQHILDLQQQFDDAISSLYRIPGSQIRQRIGRIGCSHQLNVQ